jgi:FlaA1/EpsC-like NDP-sugar epimerase
VPSVLELAGPRPPDTRVPERTPLRGLLIGAGQAGRTMAQSLRRAPDYGIVPIGFVDDDQAKRHVAGLPVLGRISDLAKVATEHRADAALVTIPSLPHRRINEIATMALSVGLTVRYLSSFVSTLERDARLTDLRSVRVDGLLGRDEVHVVRPASRSVVAGRRVLVTGAGGSIGSELCRQIDRFGPAALYMLDHDESNLHRLQLDLTGQGLLDSDDIIIADIRDRGRMRQLFADLRPEVVFHAAAHKHLPLLERYPCEGIKSNVAGTENLVAAAVDMGVERFILISTDKAADPSSILGATKRLAEMVVRRHAGGGTRMASVRFGNVLGSRGSLLSVLRSQMESGDEITITHPDVTRFFMTVEEAVGLVVEAAAMADGGDVFVLDMGDPVRIVDLVHNYADQLHLGTGELVIRFTGLRPGEKLDETLVSDNERRELTAHPKIWTSRASVETPCDLDERLSELYRTSEVNDAPGVRCLLSRLVPGYRPTPGQAAAAAAPYPDDW